MPREIRFDAGSRAALLRGLDRLATAVRVTLGPRGRGVLLQDASGVPTLISGSSPIADAVSLPDPLENLGAALGREVSGRTHDEAGDGAATSLVIAQRLVQGGFDAVDSGADAARIRRGMERGLVAVLAALRDAARPVRGREEVARLAQAFAGGAPLAGELVAEALERAGAGGVVRVESGLGTESSLEVRHGVQFDAGYLSAYFVNEPDEMRVRFHDCSVLAFERSPEGEGGLLAAMELAAARGVPLLLLGDEVDGESLTALVVRRLGGTLDVCAVEAPGFGERRRDLLRDLALLTGGVFLSPGAERRVEEARPEDLGVAAHVTVERDHTTLVAGEAAASAAQEACRELEAELERASGAAERDRLAARLARLRSRVAVIRAGGATEVEIEENRARLGDAVRAVRASLEEGVVTGGGAALVRAADVLDPLGLPGDEGRGARILAAALDAPARCLAWNAGYDPDEAVAGIRSRRGPQAFDVVQGRFDDFEALGLMDPLKVLHSALTHAVGLAVMLLTTEVLVAGDEAPSGGE